MPNRVVLHPDLPARIIHHIRMKAQKAVADHDLLLTMAIRQKNIDFQNLGQIAQIAFHDLHIIQISQGIISDVFLYSFFIWY